MMQTSSAAAVAIPRNRPREYEVTVTEVRQETHDTTTLYLDFGPERPEYRAGQFINVDPHQFRALSRFAAYLQAHKGRKEPARSYSVASAPHEPLVSITVKGEEYVHGSTPYPPLLSPLLAHGHLTGARIRVMGFMGPYVLPDDIEQQTDHIVHVVAGSGTVPNYSIIKDALHRGLKLRHTIVCSSKTWGDILYRESFEELERAHPDKLRVFHTLTREPDESRFGPRVRKGRINEALFEELIPDRATCIAYACGPAITPWDKRKALETGTPATPRFMESVLAQLRAIGIDDKRIKRESYG
jgi:3-ketosteroid 9alpha-monooxygenase subunit B